MISLTGSCSLAWVSLNEAYILPATPAGYQQVQASSLGNLSSYRMGYTAAVTNSANTPIVITSVTVVQSFPDGATEPPVSFTPTGGPQLLEPGQDLTLDGYFADGQVVGDGQLFTPAPETFEQGSCSAQFAVGSNG